ncbi:hypothetical protein CYLTODRAFT_287102 [Cylindrobasidium torrendii FP15055 ss-10]|uniref:Uncharacterized protein n=1 Tax=Cylindrobasidium torrendii FP15055 ss-10 TaxID=1314674 RepID=A0A0D7BBS2_9AGAR|nr:hypothetical protein CYLTODRAFT_287102 [Cylindrobasidium torrendii FP15055 ss-10]
MATIDSLPDDILEKIFIHTCDNYRQFRYHLWLPYENPDDCALPSQHRLLQVCRRWNVIASLSTRLWSSIVVTTWIERLSPRQVDNMHRFLHSALQRTRTALLDIDLGMNTDPRSGGALFPVLLPESHRWRRFILDLDAPLDPEDFATLRGRLPNLEWLKLKSRSARMKDVPELMDAVSQMVEDAPKLRKLECGFQHLGIKFRWDQIQELKLDFPEHWSELSSWNHFRVAVSSTSLLKLTMSRLGTDAVPWNSAWLPVSSPSIQEFTQFQLDPWLTPLELPALRKTEINDSYHLPAFTNFIQQSHCRLTTLKITIFSSGRVENFTKLTNLYAVLPHLTSLALFFGRTKPMDNSRNPLSPIVSPNTLPSLAVLHVHWYDWEVSRPKATLTLAPVFLPVFTSIVKAHRPTLESVGFQCTADWNRRAQVNWTELETLDAFVDLGSCDEVFRMNCWPTPSSRKYEYSLVRVNSA